MNNYVCMYQQKYLANLAGDCCTNCGLRHYGAVPHLTTPSSCCYPTGPRMLGSSYEDQHIFVLLKDELPTQDFNRNLATLNNAQPYSRSYSLASSHETNRSNRRTALAEETLQNSLSIVQSSDDQRPHAISGKTNRTKPLFDGNVFGILIDQLSTALTQQQYLQSLGNIDEQSDVEQEESSEFRTRSGVEHPLQRQAGELAKMRHYQEMELRFLERQEPTAQLRDHIDSLMVKQQVEQVRMQKKHRWKENRTGDGADGNLWYTSSPAACKNYYCSSCVTDDPSKFDFFGHTKSAPTVLTSKPCVSDFLSSPAGTLGIDRQRHVNTKRNAAFQREFAEGFTSRQQRIADAMADITFKYRQGIIVQTARQRIEVMEQRYRDIEAADYTAAEDASQAVNIAEARRRQNREAIADAERQLELKKAAWYRELQEIQADNRRRYEEEEEEAAAADKDIIQDQQNVIALQDVANRLKAEEQAFEVQKRKLSQDAVDNKNRQKQLE